MIFKGKRVVIRAIEEEDLEAIAKYHNDPLVARTLEFSWPISMAQQRKFHERNVSDGNTKRLAVVNENGALIGYAGLWGIQWIDRRATVGIIIGDQEHRGRGYGTDVVMTLMRVAFDQLGLNRLEAEVYSNNEGSLRLFVDHCDWQHEGLREQHVLRDGKFIDSHMVAMIQERYRRSEVVAAYWKEE